MLHEIGEIVAFQSALRVREGYYPENYRSSSCQEGDNILITLARLRPP
jgi:hypothetical protein